MIQTQIKEKPILFSTPMVKAILDGRKTMTRRVIKNTYGFSDEAWFKGVPHNTNKTGYSIGYLKVPYDDVTDRIGERVCSPYEVGTRLWVRHKYGIIDDFKIDNIDFLFILQDKHLYVIITQEVRNGRYQISEWCNTQINPNFSERGLYGRFGRADILANKICLLWKEGVRGVVSAKRLFQREIPKYINESQWKEEANFSSQVDLHGFSWDAPISILSSETFRREWEKQQSKQFSMGDSGRELDGQEGNGAWERRGKTSDGQIVGFRDESIKMGDTERISQQGACRKDTWDVSDWDIRRCSPELITWRPSIFLPKWAARIWLEVTDVRVQRLQDISIQDVVSEGISPCTDSLNWTETTINHFKTLWDSLNAKRGYGWEVNPWVWAYTFKRLEAST